MDTFLNSKKVWLFIFLSLNVNIFSISIGLESGASSYRYAEVGVNNKDDLYSFDSFLAGLSLSQGFEDIRIQGALLAQLPFQLYFSDAFGKEDYNYLKDLIYWGLNSRLGVQYLFSQKGESNFSTGVFLSHNYFNLVEHKTNVLHQFSAMGLTLSLSREVKLNDFISINISCGGSVDFISLPVRDGSLKWANNIFVTFSLIAF